MGNKLKKNSNKDKKKQMQKFSTAAILAVSIQAAWHDMKVEVNG